jgi:hypothetical protein
MRAQVSHPFKQLVTFIIVVVISKTALIKPLPSLEDSAMN